MHGMFQEAEWFNNELGQWDVSNVQVMESMFQGAILFNHHVSSWDTSKVTTMKKMFADAINFNQNISPWDITSVKKFQEMFTDARRFQQSLSWKVGDASIDNMFLYSDGCLGRGLKSMRARSDGKDFHYCAFSSKIFVDDKKDVEKDNFTYYRMSNNYYVGFHLSVSEFFMKDMQGNSVSGELICSGYVSILPDHGNQGGYCTNAIDGKPRTSWYPDRHNPGAGEVWIGYKVPRSVEVVEAYAKGLGIVSGNKLLWTGGVKLERSADGILWVEIGREVNSDSVKGPKKRRSGS